MKKNNPTPTLILFLCFFIAFSFKAHPQNPNTAYQWAKSIGDSFADAGYSIAIDATGNVYTTGTFYGTVDFDPGAGTFYLTATGNHHTFISKLDSSGNFIWAKQFSNGDNCGKSIAVDVSGNVYTTGYFGGIVDFDPGAGTYNLTTAGDYNIFISKLDASGDFIWAKQLGGTNNPSGSSMALDISGNVYVTGCFKGTADFDPGIGAYNLISAGDNDIFISKLDSSGNFIWAKQLGGTGDDVGNRCFIAEASENVYISGCFSGTADFNPGAEIYNLTSAGGYDIFISKLDSSGNFIWAKQLGGTGDDVGQSVLDASGNVYTTGYFSGTADFDPSAGTYNLTSVGSAVIFISKLDTAGNFIWAKQLGDAIRSGGFSIALDVSSNVYTTGYFKGTADFDSGVGVYNLTSAGSADIFISKLDSSGNFIWAKQLGGTGDDFGRSLVMDVSGNIYITGEFTGTVDFDSDAGTFNLTSAGQSDIFISKYYGNCNIIANASKTDETCNGNNNGSISVTAIGSTGTLLYSINNGSSYQASNIFNNLSPNTYQVIVKDANNCTTTAQSLTVSTTNYAPAFTTQPTSQTKCEGENVTFSIAVTGTPSPVYQWQKDGYNISNATSSSLTITGVTTGDAGSYTCTASNVCDTVTSNFAMFIVYIKPLITQQPLSQIKCNGQNVSFSVTATGTSPLFYQWKKDGIDIGGATSSSYSIGNVSSGDAGNYFCTISNLCGSIISDTAILTINTAPIITIHPQNQVKCTGDNVTFSVVSTGLNMMYQWKKNNSAISFANADSYTISNITAGDFGFYACDIINPCGSTTSDAATLTISNVPGQPGSVIGTNTICENQTGLSYSINAVAGADYYTWSVPSDWSIIIGQGTTAISVNAGIISGNISVTADNSCGSGIAQLLAVTVNTFPVAVISPQSNTTFCNGNSVILEANAGTGYTYLWYKDNVSLAVNTIQYTATETGAYSVQISNNDCVDTSSQVQVTALDLPVVTLSIIGDTVFCNGDSVILATSPAIGLTFQWYYNNNPINAANDSSLIVFVSGDYYVEVTDTLTGCSNVSPIVTIDVNSNPNPVISASGSLLSCINDSVTLSTLSVYSSYLWSTGVTTPAISLQTSNMYSVTVHDSNGCIGTDSIFVNESLISAPQICMVLVDSTYIPPRNLVIWDKEITTAIDYYNVYRETSTAGVYELMGSVSYALPGKLADMISNPIVETKRYKISSVDTCNNETDLSDFHQTIHISVSDFGGLNQVDITDHYMGYVFYTYNIYRYHPSTQWILVHQMPSTNNGWTDIDQPTPNMRYCVTALKPDSACHAAGSKEMGGPFTQSLSNIDEGIIDVGINSTFNIQNSTLNIYPNPFTDEATIIFSNPSHSEYILSLMDVSGKIVFSKNNITENKVTIMRNELSPGFYTLELKGDKLYKAKIIIR